MVVASFIEFLLRKYSITLLPIAGEDKGGGKFLSPPPYPSPVIGGGKPATFSSFVGGRSATGDYCERQK